MVTYTKPSSPLTQNSDQTNYHNNPIITHNLAQQPAYPSPITDIHFKINPHLQIKLSQLFETQKSINPI